MDRAAQVAAAPGAPAERRTSSVVNDWCRTLEIASAPAPARREAAPAAAAQPAVPPSPPAAQPAAKAASAAKARASSPGADAPRAPGPEPPGARTLWESVESIRAAVAQARGAAALAAAPAPAPAPRAARGARAPDAAKVAQAQAELEDATQVVTPCLRARRAVRAAPRAHVKQRGWLLPS
jgi:hypothetical protein